MFLQSMSIVAALLFVLGLVAVAVWVAKRFGAMPTGPRNRVTIEVVQRVSIGPKTGLAVVRVGEKVMAVSMGPDGMRPLFELDETDRQRVLATSTTATPFASSADAGRAIGSFLPPTLARMFQRNAVAAPVSFADSMKAALNPVAPATPLQHVPTPPEPVSAGDRDFRSMLDMAMSGATRLAVFGGAIVLSALTASANIYAQVVPPVTPPIETAPVITQPAVQPPIQPAAPQPTLPVAPTVVAPTTPGVTLPTPPVATPPAFIPQGSTRAPRTAPVRPAATRAPATSPAAPVRPQTTDSAKRAASQAPGILPGTAARGANRPGTAATAPVPGSDEALANLMPQM
ncbi:MAG: flagellar biosynthetic protein FliO, partial [Phycisphaerae bacterium]|nr:flagellar biosynthetic protein FliO [Gemmatimonadaceae bacterium]